MTTVHPVNEMKEERLANEVRRANEEVEKHREKLTPEVLHEDFRIGMKKAVRDMARAHGWNAAAILRDLAALEGWCWLDEPTQQSPAWPVSALLELDLEPDYLIWAASGLLNQRGHQEVTVNWMMMCAERACQTYAAWALEEAYLAMQEGVDKRGWRFVDNHVGEYRDLAAEMREVRIDSFDSAYAAQARLDDVRYSLSYTGEHHSSTCQEARRVCTAVISITGLDPVCTLIWRLDARSWDKTKWMYRSKGSPETALQLQDLKALCVAEDELIPAGPVPIDVLMGEARHRHIEAGCVVTMAERAERAEKNAREDEVRRQEKLKNADRDAAYDARRKVWWEERRAGARGHWRG